MVDALHQVHRVLVEGGLLIDARPDSRRLAHVEHHERGRLRPVGTVNTAAESRVDDRLSDRAIARVKREGIFRSRRASGFVHRVTFPDRAGLQAFRRPAAMFKVVWPSHVAWLIEAVVYYTCGQALGLDLYP
ncbi:MAG: hypothetical protein AAB295_03320, partial [Chloroflexota bacterium]